MELRCKVCNDPARWNVLGEPFCSDCLNRAALNLLDPACPFCDEREARIADYERLVKLMERHTTAQAGALLADWRRVH